MKIFYTKTYNISGNNARKQEIIEQAAKTLGFDELSFFKFPDNCDSDKELDYRMEGITAAISDYTTVIMQYPSMVSIRYDKAVVSHIKRHRGIKLAILVEDFGSEVAKEYYPDISEEIKLFNSADLLILQSRQMHEYLIENGLENVSVIFQELWDYPYDLSRDNIKIGTYIDYIPDISTDNLMSLKEAGFCKVMSDDSWYHAMCNSQLSGFCISAGIPMVAMKNTRMAEIVERFGIGITADSYEEAEQIINAMNDEQLKEIKSDIKKLQPAVTGGLFGKTILINVAYSMTINGSLDKIKN